MYNNFAAANIKNGLETSLSQADCKDAGKGKVGLVSPLTSTRQTDANHCLFEAITCHLDPWMTL